MTHFNFLERIVYNPIKGRVSYDLLVPLLFVFLIYLNSYYFLKSNFPFIFLYPFIYILVNLASGLYGRNRTANLTTKIAIILTGNLVASLFLLTTNMPHILISFSFIFISAITTFPRIFLNFNVERISFAGIPVKKNIDSPILVVGGAGYIGTTVVKELLNKGYNVRVFDKFIYDRNIFKGFRNINNLEIVEGDISDIFKLTLAVKDSKAIIHLAGIVGDPAARIDEKLTRHVNIASTRLLKETAKAFGVEKFIFASSCSVYGFSDKQLNEKSKCRPVSLYAKTKLDSERELLSDTADLFHPIVLRFATVFGHSKKPRFDLVANLFTAEAFYNRKITVEGGNQWRPFIHVRDVALGIVKVLEAPTEKVSRKIFNVGDDRMNTQIINLAKLVVKQSPNPSKVVIKTKRRVKDRRNYNVSFKNIFETLGYETTVTLEQGIKEMFINLTKHKYMKNYKDPFYVNQEVTKGLKKEFYSKKYRKSHFSTIS